MNDVHVGIGEFCVSGNHEAVLKTFALGSCVALITYDRFGKVAGLSHFALPDSSVNLERAKEEPGYFVDTGLPVFLEKMNRANPTGKRLSIKIVGGSNIMDKENHFDIGKRNALAIKRYLWKRQMGIVGEDIGGSISRTVSVSVATGQVVVSSGKKKWSL